MDSGCAFCAVPTEVIVRREGPCFAVWTGEEPVGSAMVLPVEHRTAPWDLSESEWAATRTLLRTVMEDVARVHRPDGWNVGWNVGPVGGQSVPHAHCHLVPRYSDEPFAGRGIRWWIKSRSNQRPWR